MIPWITLNKVGQSNLMLMKDGAVFVEHYQNINKALTLLEHSTFYLLSSNYQQNIISTFSQTIPKEQLVFTLPSYKAAHSKLNNTVAWFMYMILMKLIHVDQKIDGNMAQFYSAWQKMISQFF